MVAELPPTRQNSARASVQCLESPPHSYRAVGDRAVEPTRQSSGRLAAAATQSPRPLFRVPPPVLETRREAQLQNSLQLLEARVTKLEAQSKAGCVLEETRQQLSVKLDSLERQWAEQQQVAAAALEELHGSFDRRLEALRTELDMREMLLQCAEELGNVGKTLGEYECRFRHWPRRVSCNSFDAENSFTCASSAADEVVRAEPLARRMQSLPLEEDMPTAEFQPPSRKVRFQGAVGSNPSNESTRTPSPLG